MSKLAAAAVNEAIRQLAALDLAHKVASALEAFLVAKQLEASSLQPTIANVNKVVEEIFVVLPNHPNGRIQPFDRLGTESDPVKPKWGVVTESGRKTVWNTTTRGHGTLAAKLFKKQDIRQGLRPNAPALLSDLFEKGARPNGEALKAFLLRNEDFPSSPTRATLDQRLEKRFGLTPKDLSTFCTTQSLKASLGASPEWQGELLDVDLHPPSVTTRASGEMAPDSVIDVVVDERVRRMVKLAILSSPAVILVGPPGTGKTALLAEVIEEIRDDPAAFGFSKPSFEEPYWTTPEEGWTTRELVGGETVVKEGELRFRPGWVLKAIREDRWLVLDEANRADLDKIFGGLLTWLSERPVELGRVSTDVDAGVVTLGWNDAPESRTEGEEALQGKASNDVRFLAGKEWRLLGTYNALDAQRVFRFGQALGRRFVRVPIPPISPDEFAEVLESSAEDLAEPVKSAIQGLYAAHFASPATALGPALFLGIPKYLRAAMPPSPKEPPSGEPMPAEVSKLVAEAYLVNVGTWLARLDDSERNDLGQRVVKEFQALPESEWNWVTQLSSSLG